MDGDLFYLSAAELSALYRRREISPVEVVRAHLQRIERLNPGLRAMVHVREREAMDEAREAERAMMHGGMRSRLAGIPVGIKDVFDVQGSPTRAGSEVLDGHPADGDALSVARLRAAGAIILGKQATHEFAFGVTTEGPDGVFARNPWDKRRVPGGSSGGGAASVAAGLSTLALGSDTGGSVRIPAACCGVVGLKPTLGRVSPKGMVPLSPTLDHPGFLGRSAGDMNLLLETLSQEDRPGHATENAPRSGLVRPPQESGRGLRIGVPQDWFFEHLDPEIEQAVRSAISDLEALGMEAQEVRIGEIGTIRSVHDLIVLSEAAAWHRMRFAEKRSLYGRSVAGALDAGLRIPAADYIWALEERSRLRTRISKALQDVDVLITPTVPVPAPLIGEGEVVAGAREEAVLEAMIRFTYPFNIAGLPAASVPCGLTGEGLPIGLQIVGRAWEESTVLSVAALYESACGPWVRPPHLEEAR